MAPETKTPFRITSYNVCYTKLLRAYAVHDQPRVGLVGPHRVPIPERRQQRERIRFGHQSHPSAFPATHLVTLQAP